jgi:rSAM/selenodomain-associated transferase 2
MTSPYLSIIVPALNEAGTVRPFLRHLRDQAPDAEIIVIDGGSSDTTVEAATEFADLVLITARGRGLQLNAGAAKSRGEVLWFLHADVRIPPESVAVIQQVLSDEQIVGGFFRIRLPERGLVYRLTDGLAHYLGLLLRMRCGDHGIFCRRSTFVQLGGFPEIPLMEDAEFFRALIANGRVRWSERRLVVSSRRYQQIGPLRLTLFYGLIGALYGLGMGPEKLATIYARLCQPHTR